LESTLIETCDDYALKVSIFFALFDRVEKILLKVRPGEIHTGK
jgi:hypothetical protein